MGVGKDMWIQEYNRRIGEPVDTWDDDVVRAYELIQRLVGFVQQWPDQYIEAELEAIGELHDIIGRMNGY